MFAGIVEALGQVSRIGAAPRAEAGGTQAVRLEVAARDFFVELPPGASVAVNGVCLTLTARDAAGGAFDIIPETWRNTSLRALELRAAVNLERSLRVGDRIDGHFVQGHIDAVGQVARVDRGGGEWKLWISAPPEVRPYIIRKGSVALDGTSLTIVDVEGAQFSVALIPTTLARTVLGRRKPGQFVNIETDLLARLIVSRLAALGLAPADVPARAGGLTLEKLIESGFA